MKPTFHLLPLLSAVCSVRALPRKHITSRIYIFAARLRQSSDISKAAPAIRLARATGSWLYLPSVSAFSWSRFNIDFKRGFRKRKRLREET